jgi:hypothetical protein
MSPRTISTTKMETEVTALMRVELAQPLIDELKELIADEGFVPPQRGQRLTCSMKAKIEPL